MHKRALFVFALLAACGDDDPARHLDGGVTIDSPEALIDAPTAPVTLTIKRNGVAQSNIVVHFQNADSTLVATEMTDGSGTASHVMAPGGYVSAIDPYVVAAGLPTSQVYTFAGVKPGDHLQLGNRTSGNISMTVTLPVQSGSEITKYVMDSACSPFHTAYNSSGSGSSPVFSLPFHSTCTNTDVLVAGLNDSDDVVAFFFVPDVTVTANGALNYSSKTYSTPTSRSYTYNTATGLTPVELTQFIGSAKGAVMRIFHSTTGTPNTATVPLPNFTNAIGLTEATTRSIAESQHEILDWGPLVTTPLTSDVGARKLVDVSAPSFDAATHTLSWTEGTGVAPDGDYVGIFVNRTLPSNNNFGVEWRMVAPHTGASAKFPTLPVGPVDYNADDDDIVDPIVLLLAKLPPAGYDAMRANGFDFDGILDEGNYFDIVTTTGASSGSAALVMWVEPGTFVAPMKRVDVLRHRTRR